MKPKTGVIQYCEKKAFGSKWLSTFLVIKPTQDGSHELSLFTDKASYFTKKKAIIGKSVIKTCEINKNSHNSKSHGFRIITSKKKKYEFSCNKSSQRDEWMKFAMGNNQSTQKIQINGGNSNKKKTKNGKKNPNNNSKNNLNTDNKEPSDPWAVRSKTVRDKYEMDGGDQEFKSDLEAYFEQSTLAQTEKEKMRNMKIDTLKLIIAEWKERQTNDGGQTSKPKYWIDLFSEQTHPERALQAVLSFTPAIKANPAKFVREFGELGGMDHLIKLISFSHSGDKLREAFLRSIRAILNSPNDVGFNIVSSHSHIITAIVNMFDNKDYRIKVQCVQILLLLCWWGQNSYNEVCKSLELFASNLGRNTWWPLLINNLSIDSTTQSWEFRFYLITLINVLTNSPFIDLEDRVFIRNYQCNHFHILTKFDSIEEECQDIELDSVDQLKIIAKKIKKQIRVYNITKQQDDHEKIVNEIDLSDPDALFEIIKKGAIEYGYAEELTRILQNLLLIPNHQRSLRQHVWRNCGKAINICCNPLREQYLAEAEKEIEDEQATANEEEEAPNNTETQAITDTKSNSSNNLKKESNNNSKKKVGFKTEETKEESISKSEDISMNSDSELLDVMDEEDVYDDEEALYKERLIELPFVLDMGLEDKDGFDFYITDPFNKLSVEQQQQIKSKKKEWNQCQFIFTNLSDKKQIIWQVDKNANTLKIIDNTSEQHEHKQQQKIINVALRGGKNNTLNEPSMSSNTNTSTNQPINRRQSEKMNVNELDQLQTENTGDHMTFAVSQKGMNFFWEEKRSVSLDIQFNISHSWLIEFKGDTYAMVQQAQFFSCSLLKQFPTFMELNNYLQKLPDFQDTEKELEDKLKETEEQVTKYKEIADNRLKKLKEAADTTKKLHTQFVQTRRVAAKMQQDIQLIKQVAPKAFERVVAYQQGIELKPEEKNVLMEQSTTTNVNNNTAGANKILAAPAPAPVPASLPGAPMAAPLPGAPMAAPIPGSKAPAPLPGAPMAAPLPGAPMAAPLPGGPMAAPLPGAPMAAPLPGAPAPAPAPFGAPIPGAPAPAPAPFGAAPVPMAPSFGAPVPMAPSFGAPVPMAPSFGAPAPPPMPGMMGAPPPMMGVPGMAPPMIGRKSAFPKKKAIKPGIKMKMLHWKPINDKKIKGTIWEDISKIEDKIVEEKSKVSFFAPKKPKKPKGDTSEEKKEEKKEEEEKEEEEKEEEEKKETLEELFAAKKRKKKPTKTGGSKDKKPKKEKKELIEFIDSKRSYNVLIGLSRFKMKNADIKIAVLQMDEEVLNSDKLYKLISLVPTPEEVTQMQEYEGPENDLAKCEQFFNQFRNMDNVKERLQGWAYKMSFAEDFNDHKSKVDLLSGMAKIIRESAGFKLTLASILACGNFINGGTKKGGKHGFELETLSKIGAYRTTDSTMSILGYIYKFLRSNYPDALTWIDEMASLPQIIRIETDNLDSEITQMDKDLEKVTDLLSETKKNKELENKENKENKESESEQDKFEEIMGGFYKDSLQKVKTLQKDFNDTIAGVQTLAKFYGEKVKPSQFKLEEFFGIFNEFRLTFVENRDKIIKIESDKERDRKKLEAKKKRAAEMAALKHKKKADKLKKQADRAKRKADKAKRKDRRKKVGFAAVDDEKEKTQRKKGRKNKTDKMLDEMGDAHKYLAKLRKNRKHKSKGNLLGGARKKSMFFKDRKQMMLDPNEIAQLQKENAEND